MKTKKKTPNLQGWGERGNMVRKKAGTGGLDKKDWIYLIL